MTQNALHRDSINPPSPKFYFNLIFLVKILNSLSSPPSLSRISEYILSKSNHYALIYNNIRFYYKIKLISMK